MKTMVILFKIRGLAAQTMVIVVRMKGCSQLQLLFAHRTIGIGARINGLNAFIGIVHDAFG